MTRPGPIEDYLLANAASFETALDELLRIPSVSADAARRGDMERAAGWVAARLNSAGLSAEMVPTAGHPLVYAQSPTVAGAPAVLVYGHYDVQPPDPLALWQTPPFEPSRRGGYVYARGATDDKGQMLTHVLAAEAWMRVRGSLPLNLKFLIEGEEEVGSMALEAYLAANAEKLACDCVVVSDGSQFAPGQPAITYGLRGIAYYELTLTGPDRDLHSGTFGGSVTNPGVALARVLAGLLNADSGRIDIPGFYDDVIPLSEAERASLAQLPFDEAEYYRQIGVSAGSGEAGYSPLERRWARPTFDVNGLTCGYQGEGGKTIIPSRASAKFSFRLVPNQSPAKITQGLKARLAQLSQPGITAELIEMHGAPGVLMSLDSPAIQAASRAVERAFGRCPVFAREGGSIPIVTQLHEQLGADVLLLGWGQDDDNTHSPNERFLLADFHRGIRASALLLEELAQLSDGPR